MTIDVEAPAGATSAYWTFHEAVCRAQLAAWLPKPPARVLDLSGARRWVAEELDRSRLSAVSVLASPPCPDNAGMPGEFAAQRVVADARACDWLRPRSLHAVIAEGRALSYSLYIEDALTRLREALVPGGRLLLGVDSLQLGLGRLAEQHRWAELADLPRADVVFVPEEDGTLTRCFTPEELTTLLVDAGLEVEWVRPRTVLSAAAVDHALADDASGMAKLVRTELALAEERQGESIGSTIVAGARRPA